jgi:hypothetical protein
MAKSKDVSYKQIKKLKTTFKLLGGDRMTIGLSLIKEASFMGETLGKLKEIIEKSVVEEFKQGKQQFMREQPALRSYNALIKNYQSIMKQINDLLPDSSKRAGESLSRFLSSE